MIIKILSPSFNEPQRKKAKHNNTNSDNLYNNTGTLEENTDALLQIIVIDFNVYIIN